MKTTHPKGLYLLFTVEMWERFSYYGMRALLVLYMTKFFMMSTEKAGHLYGTYTGLVYFTPLIGGYLADRYFGQRSCIIVGGILMAIGEFVLMVPSITFFYAALIFIILGNGLFKPNISTIVGNLYEKGDPRRDGGFTIFYMGINLGALLSPLVCGTLGEKIGWHYGFGAAGVGMILGVLTLLWGQKKYLGNSGSKTQITENRKSSEHNGPLTTEEIHRIIVIFIMSFFVIFFWAAFEQAGSSLTLFADKETNRTIFGYQFPTSWFQAVNPLMIILLAPMFSNMWIGLAKARKEPSAPIKFACGLFLLSFGFVIMIAAAALYQQSGPVSVFWLIFAYLFQTFGELCLSPVGLSLVTKLAPIRFVSLLMGVWFLANTAANYVGGALAGNYDAMDHKLFFLIPTATAAAAGLILLSISPFIKRWMHGVK